MNNNDISFARNLVKGKIAETVFAQMLRSTGSFTVLDFGYEKIIPELVGRGNGGDSEMVETLRTAPDFAVINNITKEVHLIEVKYRARFINQNVLDIAERMSRNWNPSYLFLASKDGFYFGEVRSLVENGGDIKRLEHPQIPQEIQNEFLKILNDFEG
jgi:hypothetical protein